MTIKPSISTIGGYSDTIATGFQKFNRHEHAPVSNSVFLAGIKPGASITGFKPDLVNIFLNGTTVSSVNGNIITLNVPSTEDVNDIYCQIGTYYIPNCNVVNNTLTITPTDGFITKSQAEQLATKTISVTFPVTGSGIVPILTPNSIQGYVSKVSIASTDLGDATLHWLDTDLTSISNRSTVTMTSQSDIIPIPTVQTVADNTYLDVNQGLGIAVVTTSEWFNITVDIITPLHVEDLNYFSTV